MRGASRRFLIGLVVSVFLCSAAPAIAQGLTFGVKGGINFATLSAETDPGPDFGYRIGLVAGGFFTWPIASHLDVQPEGLYVNRARQSRPRASTTSRSSSIRSWFPFSCVTSSGRRGRGSSSLAARRSAST